MRIAILSRNENLYSTRRLVEACATGEHEVQVLNHLQDCGNDYRTLHRVYIPEDWLAAEGLDPVTQATAYAAAGAAALSVLTEPEAFHGELGDLEAVSAAIAAIPAMRKDFLVDPYQVWEARAAGAGGVLLVVACLDRDALARLLNETRELGMFALVEVFDHADLDDCLPVLEAAGPATEGDTAHILLGVNCRNLRTLEVDFDRFEQLAAQLPAQFPRVAESGVSEPADAAAVAGHGYGLALIGTALMRSPEPSIAAAELLTAARGARK